MSLNVYLPPIAAASFSSFSSGAAGQIPFGDGSGGLTDSASLAWSSSLKSLSLLGTVSKASAAGSTWDALTLPAATLTLTGGVAVTTATGLNEVSVYGPTITSSSATAVTNAATFYVAAAPVAGGSVTITNAYGIWSDSGANRLDGNVLIGGSSTTPLPTTALHVTGSSTVSQDVLNENLNAANGTANARFRAFVGGGSAGDPYYMATVSGGVDWAWGLDNSVTGDPWKLCASATLGNAAATDVLTATTAGSIVLGGNAALATNATDGFTYIPTCAGTPSGTPTAFTGKVAIIWDTTAHKFWVFDTAWKGGTAPGVWT